MEFRKQVTRHKTTFKIPQENYTSKKQTHTHTNAHCNNKLKTEKNYQNAGNGRCECSKLPE